MLIETKPTEPVEAHVLHLDITALQEATNLTEVLHLVVVAIEVAHLLGSEAQDQLHQEHQHTGALAAVQEVAQHLETLVGEAHTEVLHQEALEVVEATEVQGVHHQEVQALLDLLAEVVDHLAEAGLPLEAVVEADDNSIKISKTYSKFF